MSRSLVALALLVALASGACGERYPDSARREVRLGDRMWTVLLADRDGMRRMADFDGADGMLFDFDQDIDPTAVVFVMDGVDGRLPGQTVSDVRGPRAVSLGGRSATRRLRRRRTERPPGRQSLTDGIRSDIMGTDMTDSVPFQVQLTRAQHRRLKRLAESRGVSMGSIDADSAAEGFEAIL